MVPHVITPIGGRFETASDDPNEIYLSSLEFEIGRYAERMPVVRFDADPGGVYFSGSVFEADVDAAKIHGPTAELIFGTTIQDGKMISGLGAAAAIGGGKVDSSHPNAPELFDGVRVGTGFAYGPGFGVMLERSDPDGTGHLTSTLNISGFDRNINATWIDDESYLQGLIPGSTPSQYNPDTGHLEPVSSPEPVELPEPIEPRPRYGRAVTGDRARDLP